MAAVVLLVAFVALIVGTRVRQVHFRSLRRPRSRGAESVDASWFTAHTLDGFPEDAVRAAFKAQDAPSPDRLYAAWVLATHAHGMTAAWLERNLALPPQAAHLIVDAAEARHGEVVFRDVRDECARVPDSGSDPPDRRPENGR
ncbi:hypothetical protein [Streptomyces roseochromogenus]|uniref:hypothetical protein n=1 Tax=Streptomyces roseochromogenus TaxID=285450 RepID=UPI001ADFC4E1|nr:hypothetical protein [Streptomyces roseochromogenus]